jgi:hypothetical protein
LSANQDARATEPATFNVDGKPVTGIQHPGGLLERYGEDGKPTGTYVDISGATPYDTSRVETVSMTPADLEAERQSLDPMSGTAPPSLYTNLLNSPYVEMGFWNPKQWLGRIQAGPDGDMVDATQSQLASVMLKGTAGRMQEMKMQPWTPTEIRTITADFPDGFGSYADLVRFGTQYLIPKTRQEFDIAIEAGVQTPENKKRELETTYDGIIQGAKGDMGNDYIKKLQAFGVPDEEIKRYLSKGR